ncbi:MAG: Gfo/Idh/MocA family oxidoreductase, partial [Planctomycetota bacterium]|nr:Gfo/Idh/MocA family oxidoreductase [Planctomycetota bacterium]
DCEVVALAELRAATAELVARRYGVPKVYRDHREMLEKEKLDGVVASQPFAHHAALLPDIYPRVRHVFTEKPLCVCPDTGERLAKMAAGHGCVHMVGYHKRSDAAANFAREKIVELKNSGRLGQMRYVRVVMPPGDWIAGGMAWVLNAGDKRPPAPGEQPPADLDEKMAKEYVAFVNYYIHQVNLLRYLLGEPYRVAYADRSGVLLVAESASGITASIEMAPYRTTVEWEEEAMVAFEKGYIRLRLFAPLTVNRAGEVEVYEDPGDGAVPMRSAPALPWEDAMRRQAANFVRVCRGEIEPPCAAAEAVEDLKVAREYIRARWGK